MAVVLGFQAGCSQSASPWSDDTPSAESAMTASVQIARAVTAQRAQPIRGFDAMVVSPVSGRVTHWPSFWEDPYESYGSEDGAFRWTAEDYWATYYGLGHNLVTSALLGVRAAVTPPHAAMVSDGSTTRPTRNCN